MTLRVNKIIYKFGIIILLLSGIFYGVKTLSFLQPLMLAFGLLTICISAGRLYLNFARKDILSKIFFLFIIFIMLSMVAHFEVSILITFLGLILIWFTMFIQIPMMKIQSNDLYSNDTMLILYVLLIVHIISILTDFTTYRFAGIYTNSNFTGGEACALCAISCSSFLRIYFDETKRRTGLVVSGLAIAVSTVVGLATNSRTSVMTIVILLFLTMIFMLSSIKNKKYFRRMLIVVFILVIVAFVAYKLGIVNSAITEIVVKFTNRRGNELAGRQERWAIVFQRLQFFGNGEKSAFGTHNTFLSMLDQYGYVPCFLLALFVIVGIIKSLIFVCSDNDDDNKYLPLFCFICFGVTCMFEQMMLKNIMFLCLYSASIMTYRKKIK